MNNRKRCSNETDISAQQKKKGKDTRLFKKDVHQAGKAHNQQEKGQGAQAADGLNPVGHQGIGKKERLLRRREFLYLSSKGRAFGNRYFVAAYLPNDLGYSRLGITVTRKTGKAVVRNRIKRLVREFFRHNRHLLDTGVDVNVIAKKAAAGAGSRQIFSALRHVFSKIGRHED